MATIQVTENNLEATISERVVLLDFWASWCAPCRAFSPVFEAASEAHPEVLFGKIDVEAEPGLAEAFQISSIPTLAVFRDGVLLGARPGGLSSAELGELVRRVRALDMDEVRKHIAQEGAPSARPAADGAS
jgi:thioredoxin 1